LYRLKSGVEAIDELLLGGIPSGSPVCLYGIYQIGKSMFCLQLATKTLASYKDARVIYLDTESFLLGEPFDLYWKFFSRRFGLEEKDKKRLVVWQTPGIHKMGRPFGIEYEVVQEEERTSIIVKFPKKDKGSKEKTKKTSQAEDWISYSPLYKELEKGDVKLLVLDSITMPIKESIPAGMQNFPARSSIISSLLAAIRLLAHRFDVSTIYTDHGVKNPMKYRIDPWGGGALIHGTKHILGILDVNKETKDKLDTQDQWAKKFYRYRYPGVIEDARIVLLRKDYGYVDLERKSVIR